MAGVNRVILIGNLGKDPETRTLENGVKVSSLRLATTERFTSRSGEKTEHTEWHNVVAWRGLAEVAERYLRKGNSVYVEGKIRNREWDDRDGNKRYTFEIIADNMIMLGGRRDQADEPSSAPDNEPLTQDVDMIQDPQDDLPF